MVYSLRDFKETARDLIEQSKIQSIIHPLLADHVFREADRFLEIIDLFDTHLTSGNHNLDNSLMKKGILNKPFL